MFESVPGKWQGKFEEQTDPMLDHELVVIERTTESGYTCFSGPMEVVCAMVRGPDGETAWVDGWQPTEGSAKDPVALWEYWTDKGGGNGYTTEVAFLRANGGHVTEAVALLDKALRAIPLDEMSQPQISSIDELARSTSDRKRNDEQRDDEEQTWSVPEHLADALTWSLAAQLVRRHPKVLWVVNTHPLDGFYDCLAISDVTAQGRPILTQMNRRGTSLAFFDGALWRWTRGWDAEDPRDWIVRVEERLGLRPPSGGLPPSTPSSLAVRWIAQFMAMQLGSRDRWRTTGGLPPRDTLSLFRGLHLGPDEDAWRYWTLTAGQDGSRAQRQILLSIDGWLYTREQDPVQLISRHRSGDSIAKLVLDSVPQHAG